MTASRERKTLSLRLAYYISSPILRLRVGDFLPPKKTVLTGLLTPIPFFRGTKVNNGY